MAVSKEVLCVYLVLVTILMTCMVSAVEAGDTRFGLSADLLVADSYVWRGMKLDDSWSLQPSVTLAYRLGPTTSLGLNGWWNIALDDHGLEQWQDLLYEQDFTLSLDYDFNEELSLSTGYIYYSNPRSDVLPGSDAWQTDELFVGLSWQPGPLAWSATLYRDFDLVKGWYLDCSVSGSVSLHARFTWDSGGQLGLASGMKPNLKRPEEASWYLDDGLVNGSLWTGLGWSAGRWRASATVTYSARFDDWQEETGLDDSYLWWAVAIGLDF